MEVLPQVDPSAREFPPGLRRPDEQDATRRIGGHQTDADGMHCSIQTSQPVPSPTLTLKIHSPRRLTLAFAAIQELAADAPVWARPGLCYHRRVHRPD